MKNEKFTIIKHLSDDVYFVKYFNENFTLSYEEWFYKDNNAPFYIADYDKRTEFYNENLFDETILDTPVIKITKINDSLYNLKVIPKDFPIRIMSEIEWNFIENNGFKMESKFNYFSLTLNTNKIYYDSIPSLSFKFYHPNTNKLIKQIGNYTINFNLKQ